MGAYGGRKDIMEMVAPAGPMYQAGTLSGNPLAMTAGIETLKRLKDESGCRIYTYIYIYHVTCDVDVFCATDCWGLQQFASCFS